MKPELSRRASKRFHFLVKQDAQSWNKENHKIEIQIIS